MKSNYWISKCVNEKEPVYQWCKKEKEREKHLIEKCEGVERKRSENIHYQHMFTGYHLANWLIRVLDTDSKGEYNDPSAIIKIMWSHMSKPDYCRQNKMLHYGIREQAL